MKESIIVRNEALRRRAIAMIERVPVDVPHEVIVREHKSSRSLAQNRLLWSWMKEIADHLFESTGQQYSSDEVHEWCKDQFLGKRVVVIEGHPVIVNQSTAKLNIKQFAEYLERIDHYTTESLGLTLSHPDDLWNEATYESHPVNKA